MFNNTDMPSQNYTRVEGAFTRLQNLDGMKLTKSQQALADAALGLLKSLWESIAETDRDASRQQEERRAKQEADERARQDAERREEEARHAREEAERRAKETPTDRIRREYAEYNRQTADNARSQGHTTYHQKLYCELCLRTWFRQARRGRTPYYCPECGEYNESSARYDGAEAKQKKQQKTQQTKPPPTPPPRPERTYERHDWYAKFRAARNLAELHAFRQQAMKSWHPDQGGNTRVAQEINVAFDSLRPRYETRRAYA